MEAAAAADAAAARGVGVVQCADPARGSEKWGQHRDRRTGVSGEGSG